MKSGRSLLCFPLEFLRTLLANLVHTNDNDAARGTGSAASVGEGCKVTLPPCTRTAVSIECSTRAHRACRYLADLLAARKPSGACRPQRS